MKVHMKCNIELLIKKIFKNLMAISRRIFCLFTKNNLFQNMASFTHLKNKKSYFTTYGKNVYKEKHEKKGFY